MTAPSTYTERLKTLDAAERAAEAERRERHSRNRLALAGRLAAGMLANPETYRMQSWEAEVTRRAVRLADRLMVENAKVDADV